MTRLLHVEVSGPIQTIRFDRPERMNALTSEMFDAAADAVVLGEGDGKVRVLVIAGMPGAFTVGSDNSEFREYVETGAVTPSSIRFLKTLATVDKPVVAAVDGPALGVGTTLLLLCDHVVASEWSLFVADHVSLGLPLDAAATLLGPRLLGHHLAFELLVMGQSFDAARAREAGLVNRVVPPEALEDAARAAAEQIAGQPPEAVRMARRMMLGDRRDVAARIAAEAATFPTLQLSPHASGALQRRIASGRGARDR